MRSRTVAGLVATVGLAGAAAAQPAASFGPARTVGTVTARGQAPAASSPNEKLAQAVGLAAGRRGDFSVTADAGVVTLVGTCGTEADKAAVLQLARATAGVKLVRDGLTVPGVQQTQGTAASAATFKVRSDATPPAAAPPAAAPPMATAPAYAPPAGCLYGDCAPGAASCSACDCLCGPPGKYWLSGEYLYWTAKGMSVPPLATTSPLGTARGQAGVLGAPGTSVLFPESGKTNDDWRSGFRLRAGMWLDDCQRFGVEGDFFFLGRSKDDFAAGGNGAGVPIISRPFTNVLSGANDSQLVSFPGSPASELVSFPGVLAGSVDAHTRSDFIGGGFNFLCNHSCTPCDRLDYLVGFRYLNLRDEVVVNENLTALGGSSVPAGTRFLIQDKFRTTNDFYGGNVGLNYERRMGSCFVGVRGSVALGVTHSETEISGSTQIVTPAGVGTTYPGGLLTQTSNIGRYSSNRFSVVPEVGVRVGCQVTERARAFVGYNFLYWSNVQRAGDQIDLGVNTNLIAPASGSALPARPAYTPRTTDYWVQGVSFGLEWRF